MHFGLVGRPVAWLRSVRYTQASIFPAHKGVQDSEGVAKLVGAAPLGNQPGIHKEPFYY